MKKLFFALLVVHLLTSFLIAFRDVRVLFGVKRIAYIDSYFRQGWAFFAPLPVVNYPLPEYQCIYSDKVKNWNNIITDLERSKPASKFLISNNHDYLIESLVNRIIYTIPEEEYKSCGLGNCDLVQMKMTNLASYQKLSQITNDLCKKHDPNNLLGSKVKIILKNTKYFSDRMNNKGHVIYDFMELPVAEI